MDSSGLNCSSVEELQSKCSIPRELTQKLERMSCEDVYKSMTTLLKSARASRGEQEKQYHDYMKAAELAEMIRKNKNFNRFISNQATKLTFYSDFEECVKNMSDLQTLLTRKYDAMKLRKDTIGRANSSENENNRPATVQNVRKVNFTISPKDLIRMMETDAVKKSAIIFDYRQDKSDLIHYRNENLITVIHIPYETVDTSMIFSKMRQSLDVGQRSLLQRLPNYDLVVLMEDDTPELRNGQPIAGTKASSMMKALTDYIGNDFRTKETPIFMEGGFRRWKNQYPTYTTTSEILISPRISTQRDELDDVIQKYRDNNSISNINFVDLSAIPPKPSEAPKKLLKDSTNIRQNEEKEETVVARPGFGIPLTGIQRPLQPPPPTSLSQPPSIPLERPGGPIFNPAPKIAPTIPQRPVVPPAQPHLPNIPPAIPDRSAKPNAIIVGRSDIAPGPSVEPSIRPASASQNNSIRKPPTLDRATKPSLITPEREDTFRTIYNKMMGNISSSATRRSDPAPGMTGLYNMGNTCFMSATLQCLFQTPGLVNVFTHDQFISNINPLNKMGTKGVISSVFSALVDCIWSGQFQAIRPQRFLQLFAEEVNSTLADGHQHDASEFQLFLLDALHEDTNQVVNRISFEQNYKGGRSIASDAADFIHRNKQFAYSPVNKIFSVLTVSELTCCNCQASSATFEDNTLISVELTQQHSNGQYNLDTCLKSHFSDTKLDGDSRWNCPKCKSAQAAIRRTRLWTLPSVLVIHLKRFSLSNGEYVKNTQPVQFEIQRFDPSDCLHQNAPRDQKSTYRLYGVTNHSGRLNSGHYTAMASHLKSNKWLRFDDESVCSTDVAQIDNRAAYILFYKKMP